MSDFGEELERKAREWEAEAERTTEQWRPMCQMLAREYSRLSREQSRLKTGPERLVRYDP